MRVHGRYIVRRRTNINNRPYAKYREELREDFQHICGYCGKSEAVAKNGFEIDHFVPQNISTRLRDEYQNLVYSCHLCNRKKWDKWPTGDANIYNDGKKGFVDPTSAEYDEHLERDENGKIVPKTPLGEYLCNEAFDFKSRPIDVVWKAMRIVELKKELQQKITSLSSDELKEYINIDNELNDLSEYLFDKKE